MRLSSEEIRAIRARSKLLQREMAERLGVHVRTYRTWEINETGVNGSSARLLKRMDEEGWND